MGLNNHPPPPHSVGSVAVIISSKPSNPLPIYTTTHCTPPCPALHLPFTYHIPCKLPSHLHHSHTHSLHIPQTLSPSAPQPPYTPSTPTTKPHCTHTPHKSFTHLHHSHTTPLKPLLHATFEGLNCFVYNS